MSEGLIARSARPETRNPVLALPTMQRLLTLPLPLRALLSDLVADLGVEARTRSQTHLKRNKWWSAMYWRGVAIYAQHIARAIRRGGARGR